MKLRYLTLFFTLSLTCSCFAQDRFLESDVVMDHDTMFLKKEMHKITAIVYNKHGDIGYFKNDSFNGFIKINKSFWSKHQINTKSNDTILVESFVNHPAYALSNCILANYLKKIYGKKITGIIKKNNYEVFTKTFLY